MRTIRNEDIVMEAIRRCISETKRPDGSVYISANPYKLRTMTRGWMSPKEEICVISSLLKDRRIKLVYWRYLRENTPVRKPALRNDLGTITSLHPHALETGQRSLDFFTSTRGRLLPRKRSGTIPENLKRYYEFCCASVYLSESPLPERVTDVSVASWK